MSIDVDDVDEKTRRNLVVASGTLIATWIAGVPIPRVIEKFIGQDVELISWRVLLAILFMLTYLILRFRFASQTQTAYRDLQNEWRTKCCEQVISSVKQWLEHYTRTGKESKNFVGSLSESEHEATKNISEKFRTFSGEKPKLDRPTIKSSISFVNSLGAPESDVFNGKVHVQYEWNYLTQTIKGNDNFHLDFKITGIYRIWLKAKALIKLISYTKSSMQILVPSILAFVSFLNLTIQLGMSLCSS